MKPNKRGSSGFTLVEIMVVVAIIAMLAVIALPNYLRSARRAMAARMLDDLKVIDNSIQEYALEASMSPGEVVEWAKIQRYLKPATILYGTGKSSTGFDYLLFEYKVDVLIETPPGTGLAFGDITDLAFWSPYILKD